MPRYERERVVVLAAGQGRRMGGPKALLDLEGRPLWQHQAQRLDSIGIDPIWVVSEEIRQSVMISESHPTRLVVANSEAPMFASLIAGLRALPLDELDGVFVLPVDVPAPPDAVWSSLCLNDRPTVPGCDGARGHPVRLPIPWIVSRKLLDQSPDDTRLDQLLASDAVTIEVGDLSVLTNLNRPADLERWKQER